MVYFILYLFLEVMISVNISSQLGGLFTFFEIILSAIVGISILLNFKKTLLDNLRAVSYSCIDLKQFERLNLFTLFGAIFLIVPGFLTDIAGVFLQFSIFTSLLVNHYHVKSAGYDRNYNKKDQDVIDVEIVEHNTAHR